MLKYYVSPFTVRKIKVIIFEVLFCVQIFKLSMPYMNFQDAGKLCIHHLGIIEGHSR